MFWDTLSSNKYLLILCHVARHCSRLITLLEIRKCGIKCLLLPSTSKNVDECILCSQNVYTKTNLLARTAPHTCADAGMQMSKSYKNKVWPLTDQQHSNHPRAWAAGGFGDGEMETLIPYTARLWKRLSRRDAARTWGFWEWQTWETSRWSCLESDLPHSPRAPF